MTGFAVPFRERTNEIFHQSRDIFLAIAQRRKVYGKHVYAIEQVRTKPIFADHAAQILIGGRNHTDINPRRGSGPFPDVIECLFLWRTRRSFGWSSSGRSPISSRKSVPRSAA